MLEIADTEIDALIERTAALRVGGEYWGSQPDLSHRRYSLIRIRDRQSRADAETRLSGDCQIFDAPADADPWHLVSGAAEVLVDADDELALVAALAGVPVRCVGKGRFNALEGGGRTAVREAFCRYALRAFTNPFTGAAMTYAEAIELAGFWRALIDSNRDITAAVGFAAWKRETVAPLLWAGSPVPFGKAGHANPPGQVAVWRSRTRPSTLAELQRSGAQLIEVEDGFIRSIGLGADCVPPLSIVVDRIGIYFDPSQPSTLEQLLQEGDFPSKLVVRASQLRELIINLGISKYGVGHSRIEIPSFAGKPLLVVGQVEDDRAFICGLGPGTNLELLKRVRENNPDAHLIYKPHPDVEAGHRKGAIPDEDALKISNAIVRNAPITSLIDLVDEVHVNTSLAGFEALLRGKEVTTYGVPFYAGWGLTRDLGPIPARRSSRRTLDELVAAALLAYPRYLDPVTRLPCPAEVLIRRLAEQRPVTGASPLVRLRRLQGRLKRAVASFQRAS